MMPSREETSPCLRGASASTKYETGSYPLMW